MHLEILSCKYRFFSLLRVLISFKTLLTVVFWCFPAFVALLRAVSAIFLLTVCCVLRKRQEGKQV